MHCSRCTDEASGFCGRAATVARRPCTLTVAPEVGQARAPSQATGPQLRLLALQGEAALSTWTADVPRQAPQASQVAIGPRWPKAYLEAQVAPVHLQAMPPPRVVGLLQAQVHLQAMGGPMPAPRKMTTRTTMTSWAHQLRMTLARESGSRALPAQVASVPLPAWLPLRVWGRLQPQGHLQALVALMQTPRKGTTRTIRTPHMWRSL